MVKKKKNVNFKDGRGAVALTPVPTGPLEKG